MKPKTITENTKIIKITKKNILDIMKEEIKKETDSKSKLSNGKN